MCSGASGGNDAHNIDLGKEDRLLTENVYAPITAVRWNHESIGDLDLMMH